MFVHYSFFSIFSEYYLGNIRTKLKPYFKLKLKLKCFLLIGPQGGRRRDNNIKFLQGRPDLDESLPLPVHFDLLPSFVEEDDQDESGRLRTRASGTGEQSYLPITCASIRSTGLGRVEIGRSQRDRVEPSELRDKIQCMI